MKAAEIKVGGLYRAKVNGRLTTVRVDRIEKYISSRGTDKEHKVYHVTNTATGRTTVYRSAAKFKGLPDHTPLSGGQLVKKAPAKPMHPETEQAIEYWRDRHAAGEKLGAAKVTVPYDPPEFE